MATLAKLFVELGMDSSGMAKGTASAKKSLHNLDDSLDQSEKKTGFLKKSLGGIGSVMGGILGAQVATGAIGMAKGFVMANASAEQTAMSLETVTGSAEKATAIMGELRSFAASTPFEFPELAQASINLESFGMKTMDWLPTIGDTAAAMGTSVDQVTQAVLDVSTGEYERLKELGIKASIEGDKLNLRYMENGKEIVKTVDKTNSELVLSTVKGIWNEKYAGAMEKQSKTFIGQWSTLKDNINLMMMQVTKPLFELSKKGLDFANKIFTAFGANRAKGMSITASAFAAIQEVVAATFGPKAAAQITAFMDGAIKWFYRLVTAIKFTIKVFGLIANFLAPFAKKFWAATKTIRYGIRLIVEAFQRGGIKEAMQAVFGKGGQMILKGLGRILGLVPRMIGEFLRNITTGFGPLDKILHNLGKAFSDTGLLIQHILSGEWGQAFDVAKDLFFRFINQYKLIGELLLVIFKAIPWETIGAALYDGLVVAGTFMQETGYPWLWEKAKALLSAIYDAFTAYWESDIKPWLNTVPGLIVDLLAVAYPLLYTVGRTLLSWLWTGISSLWNWLAGQLANLPGALVSALAWAGWMFFNFGRDIISNIWNGIVSLWNWLLGQISNLPGAIWNALSDVPGHSPMEHAAAEIGRAAMSGIAMGLRAGRADVLAAARYASATVEGAATGTARLAAMPSVTSAANAGSWRQLNVASGAIVVNDATNPERTAQVILRAIRGIEAGAA